MLTGVSSINEQAHGLIKQNRYDEAVPLLRQSINEDKSQWNAWELLGLCYRFIGEIDHAVHCLKISTKINPDNKSAFLALGIAYQIKEQFEDSLSALRRATELDRDFVAAYNSAAMTLKLMGDIAKSIEVYEHGLILLAREFCFNAVNDQRSPIFKHLNTQGHLWIKYLMAAILQHAVSQDCDRIAWPTGASAEIEEREETHQGLYWEDILDDHRNCCRLYFPNFFNTALRAFIADQRYTILVGNKSTVLRMVGQDDESDLYLREAQEFKDLNNNF
jgi:tetratricopeptide (TPR) repeat protein